MQAMTISDIRCRFYHQKILFFINFMVIHKPALLQYPKHTVNKVISPDANQDSDGWLFFYRAYGLADVYENKVAGIYLHHKA